ncbi:MAG: PD40 domain-containing protein [Bryobacterales bacterium]|nr:PD40 domain-containing protein [Bryobacterales bacterium]
MKLRFGPYLFNTEGLELTRDSHVVHLSPQPAMILRMLLAKPGEIVERDKLRETLWPSGTHVQFEVGLNTAVNRLRRVLNDTADTPHYIETIPRTGYRFIAPVQVIDPPADEPPAKPVEAGTRIPAEPETAHAAPKRGWLRWAAVAAAISCVGLAVQALSTREPALLDFIKESRPFTNLASRVEHPSFSPDSKSAAFDWDGPDGTNRDIWLQSLDSATPVRFTTREEPETWPVWSPDGARIAFLRRTAPNQTAVVIRPLLSSEEKVLAHIPIGDHDRPRLDWGRDGKWLISSARSRASEPSRLVLIDAKTGNLRFLAPAPPEAKEGDTEPVFSPDGREIAFRRSMSPGIEDVYILRWDGGPGTPRPARRLTADNRSISGVVWRNNGKSLLVSTRRAGAFRQLWEFFLDGTPPSRITPAVIDAGGPALSRDGQALLFVQTFEDKNIYRIGLSGTATPQPVTTAVTQDMDPSVSPDGKLLAFRSARTGSDEIWVVQSSGENERRLTSMDGPSTGSARWSPDGRYIAFDSRPTGKADIYVIPSSGGTPVVLTPPESHEATPAWAPDGQILYFVSNRSGVPEIWRQPAGGGAAQQVTKGGGGSPKLSRDGATLYFTRQQPGGVGLLSLSLKGALPGAGERLLSLDSRMPGHWAIGASGIYHVLPGEKTTTSLHLYSFQTRTTRHVLDLPGMPSFFDGGLAIAPDETAVYFTKVDRIGSNLVLARASGLFSRNWSSSR